MDFLSFQVGHLDIQFEDENDKLILFSFLFILLYLLVYMSFQISDN